MTQNFHIGLTWANIFISHELSILISQQAGNKKQSIKEPTFVVENIFSSVMYAMKIIWPHIFMDKNENVN